MEVDMEIFLRKYIERQELAFDDTLQLPKVTLEPQRIHALMINEVVTADPRDGFYSAADSPACLETVVPLFHQAGMAIRSVDELLQAGIYLTNAVKAPKSGYAIETATIKAHAPLLAQELALFPSLQVIMLMGDVAKKAFNLIAKLRSGRNAIPAGPTYRLRHTEFYYDGVRVLPSYIMTGANILIEKSKFAMAAEDIRSMLDVLCLK